MNKDQVYKIISANVPPGKIQRNPILLKTCVQYPVYLDKCHLLLSINLNLNNSASLVLAASVVRLIPLVILNYWSILPDGEMRNSLNIFTTNRDEQKGTPIHEHKRINNKYLFLQINYSFNLSVLLIYRIITSFT